MPPPLHGRPARSPPVDTGAAHLRHPPRLPRLATRATSPRCTTSLPSPESCSSPGLCGAWSASNAPPRCSLPGQSQAAHATTALGHRGSDLRPVMCHRRRVPPAATTWWATRATAVQRTWSPKLVAWWRRWQRHGMRLASTVRTAQFDTILNEPSVIIIQMRVNTCLPESVPRVIPHLETRITDTSFIQNNIKSGSPGMCSNIRPESAYAHTVYNRIHRQ